MRELHSWEKDGGEGELLWHLLLRVLGDGATFDIVVHDTETKAVVCNNGETVYRRFHLGTDSETRLEAAKSMIEFLVWQAEKNGVRIAIKRLEAIV